jgi:hypothetical protein
LTLDRKPARASQPDFNRTRGGGAPLAPTSSEETARYLMAYAGVSLRRPPCGAAILRRWPAEPSRRRNFLGEIGHVYHGTVGGRIGETVITVYKSLGVAAQDLATAREIVMRARTLAEAAPR